jgi:hypothetical protein
MSFRCVIVDDQTMFLQFLAGMVRTIPGLEGPSGAAEMTDVKKAQVKKIRRKENSLFSGKEKKHSKNECGSSNNRDYEGEKKSGKSIALEDGFWRRRALADPAPGSGFGDSHVLRFLQRCAHSGGSYLKNLDGDGLGGFVGPRFGGASASRPGGRNPDRQRGGEADSIAWGELRRLVGGGDLDDSRGGNPSAGLPVAQGG